MPVHKRSASPEMKRFYLLRQFGIMWESNPQQCHHVHKIAEEVGRAMDRELRDQDIKKLIEFLVSKKLVEEVLLDDGRAFRMTSDGYKWWIVNRPGLSTFLL